MKMWNALLLAGLAQLSVGCATGLNVSVEFGSAEGFQRGDPVVHEGTQIGKVEAVHQAEDKAVLDLGIDSAHKAKVRDGAQFRLHEPGIIGGPQRAVVLHKSGEGAPATSGTRFVGVTRAGAILGGIRDAISNFSQKVDGFLERIKGIEAPEAKAFLDKTRTELEKAAARGGDSFAKFREETIPELKEELEEVREKLIAAGKSDQAKKLEEAFQDLFE